MVDYNLSHLTQPATQDVAGPIQDDEALALFALVRCMRMNRILEVGGLGGYSARNFVAALHSPSGVVYSCDIVEVPKQGSRHAVIVKDAANLTPSDVGGLPLDLIFFDCHADTATQRSYDTLSDAGIIGTNTIIALHDTNIEPNTWAHSTSDCGDVERRFADTLQRRGWHAVHLHTQSDRHGPAMPRRNGLTILQWPRTIGHSLKTKEPQ
jgi:predicted O-methyltransferase YrrM